MARVGRRHRGRTVALAHAVLPIRVIGDPVLRTPCPRGRRHRRSVVRLANEMIETLHDAPGVGLAAPQVGVLKRMFVYDLYDGRRAGRRHQPGHQRGPGRVGVRGGLPVDPGHVLETAPGPRRSTSPGVDLDGNELSIDADELLARVYQHETDHLDGVLFIDRLDNGHAEAGPQGHPRAAAHGPGPVAGEAGQAGAVVRPPDVGRRASTMRIVYLGTPDVAVAPLEAIVEAGHDVALVVTAPDRRRGRGRRWRRARSSGRRWLSVCRSPTGSTTRSSSIRRPSSAWWWPSDG